MLKIKIKPISVNEAYRGRRFSTNKLKTYKQELEYLLPKLKISLSKKDKIRVKYEFGVSSKQSDGDNLIKAFQDCIANQYGFNDKQIYKWEILKVDVEKGDEYVAFDIGITVK